MIHFASGTKYALPAEVPGSKTNTFLAVLEPTLMTPTLSYGAGVPGAAKPAIHVTPNGVDTVDGGSVEPAATDVDELELDGAGPEACDEEPQLDARTAMHTTVTAAART